MLEIIKKNKNYIIIILIIVFFIILNHNGLLSKENKISKNMQLRSMFQSEARKNDSHQRAAEQNWMAKYFNINF